MNRPTQKARPQPHSRSGTVTIGSRQIPRVLLLGAIFVLALAVRGLYLVEYSQSPHWDLLSLDTHTHDLLARDIAFRNAIGDHPFFRAPLYPYLLAATYAVAGPGLLLPRLINIVLGALSCVLLYLIGERLFRPPIALLASIIASLYWVLIYFDGELLLVTVYLTLILLAALLLLRSDGRASAALVAAGLVLGLAAITRPNILAFVPVVLLWLARDSGRWRCDVWRRHFWRRDFWLRAALFCLPLVIVLGTVAVRNRVVGDDNVFIAYQAGVNFFIGNHSGADGRSATPPCYADAIPRDYRQRHAGNVWVHDDVWLCGYHGAEQSAGRQLKPSEMEAYWFERAFADIGAQPGSFVALLARKCYFFLNAYEIPSNRDLYTFVRDSSRLLRGLSILDFGVIVSLGLLGIAVTLRQWRRLLLWQSFVVIYALTNVLFFINTRYRLPIIPFLLLFAVYFVFWLLDELRQRRRVRAVVAIAACAVLLVVTHTEAFDLKDARHASTLHFNLGTALAKKGRYEAAVDEYQQAVRLFPGVPKPYESLAQCYMLLGQPDRAVAWAAQGVERFPEWPRLRHQLGTAHLEAGAWQEAVPHLEEVVRLEPELLDAAVKLGIAYYNAGATDAAARRFEANLTLAPEDPFVQYTSQFHLGLIAFDGQDPESGRRRFEEALRHTGDPTAALRVAAAFGRYGEVELAMRIIDGVLRVDPRNRIALQLQSSVGVRDEH